MIRRINCKLEGALASFLGVGEAGFFNVEERLKRLRDLGDQLLGFAAAVDFEIFRSELTRALAYSDGS